MNDIARIGEIFEKGLQRFGGPYLAGPDFTAADAFFAPVVFRIRTFDIAVGERAQDWVLHMFELPAMEEWERQALAESYREAEHERELATSAAIVADHRIPVVT